MQNESAKSPDGEKKLWLQPEIDYTPKKYTQQEKILLGIKFFSFVVIFSFMFWLLKYLMHYLYN